MLARRFTMICLICMIFGMSFAHLVQTSERQHVTNTLSLDCSGPVQHWRCHAGSRKK